MKELDDQFDAGAYWRNRVVSGSDVETVGHRSMGRIYNRQIYERRLEALDAMIERHVAKPAGKLRVLDIGCGSGFYTGYWAARGVSDYVGVDISADTIGHLRGQYPDFEFVCADVTEPGQVELTNLGRFDVVTIFDVLYHIVDERRFANALEQTASLTNVCGILLVMDQLCSKTYQLSRHVVYRDRGEYFESFSECGFDPIDHELLFHFLVPPLSGVRLIDYSTAATFKLLGLVARSSDRIANWLATRLRRFDRNLRLSGKSVSNSELLVFKKRESSFASEDLGKD